MDSCVIYGCMYVYSSYHTLLSLCMQILKVLIMEPDSYYLDICVTVHSVNFLVLYIIVYLLLNFYEMDIDDLVVSMADFSVTRTLHRAFSTPR